jgi:hypothetical protein
VTKVQHIKTAIAEDDFFILKTPDGDLFLKMIPGEYF